MSDEVAIICSRADPASLNIAERLQELAAWEDHGGYSSFGPWRRLSMMKGRLLCMIWMPD